VKADYAWTGAAVEKERGNRGWRGGGRVEEMVGLVEVGGG